MHWILCAAVVAGRRDLKAPRARGAAAGSSSSPPVRCAECCVLYDFVASQIRTRLKKLTDMMFSSDALKGRVGAVGGIAGERWRFRAFVPLASPRSRQGTPAFLALSPLVAFHHWRPPSPD